MALHGNGRTFKSMISLFLASSSDFAGSTSEDCGGDCDEVDDGGGSDGDALLLASAAEE